THVDIDNDGLEDIYICRVGNYNQIKGKNLLYINKGINEKGIPSFEEKAEEYGLDFSGFSTQASFFDFDLDGDLDMYLLNHSVYPNRTYGKGVKRNDNAPLSGDVLFENIEGKFIDVSAKAGIFQGEIGYGLGLGISDLNNDGYPDIYVGNDFFENDYLYINQRDGTFKDIISQDINNLGHTSHFSMGNDLADINNDGFDDIISLDMLPEDLITYKTSGLEFPYTNYQQYLKNGYAPQYMQNTLHLNLGNETFAEIGNLAGISATEWSWGPLLADFNNDGFKDIYISNGIKGATNDMDFINFISDELIQKKIREGMSEQEMEYIKSLPQKKVANYFFRNQGDLTFENVTDTWFVKEDSFSNGCTYADLDNDGDLDIIVNNIDEEAFVLENRTLKDSTNNFLKIKFKGGATNLNGIGSKIIGYHKNGTTVQQHFVTKGYLSSVPQILSMGIGLDAVVDSLQIIWPGGKFQTFTNVSANQTITADIDNAKGDYFSQSIEIYPELLSPIDSLINFRHQELPTVEFVRDPLIPFTNTNGGPKITIGDINGDALQDFIIGGAKKQASVLFIQDSMGSFKNSQKNIFDQDSQSEDTFQLIFDADADGDSDLLIVSGGNEFRNGPPLNPRLYINNNSVFTRDTIQFKTIHINASKAGAIDFDQDGDLDVIITSDQVPWQFGQTPQQYILENDGTGRFKDVTNSWAEEFKNIGNIKDFTWADVNNDGTQDLIVVGHWMPITIFLKLNGKLVLQSKNGIDHSNGWYNTVKAADMDMDGDIDFIVGNWGLNSKFNASIQKPITLYSYDFDKNGTIDPLVTYFYGISETPFASKDELVKQMPFLNKNFLSYRNFAEASISEMFTAEKIEKSQKKMVYELRSGYYENDGDANFSLKTLPNIAQASTIKDIAIDDLNDDGYPDLIMVGNDHEISTQLGRMDALHGLILMNDTKGGFIWAEHQNLNISGQARSIEKTLINDHEYFIIGMNNDYPIALKKNPKTNAKNK
ncbi:MAG: VCBS repeat-containing protein, partial [Flavobacteriaceae bacterium]